MNILDLPVEIGNLILSYLDTKSKISVYSIFEFRQFYAPCLLRKFDISRSSVASMKTLTLDIFQDFAANIQELNLSGIADLTVDKLVHHIQQCTNLKTLDVTFTSIYLSDLAELCTEYLKNISINFFKWPRKNKSDDVWRKTLNIFKRQQFERVHFVVLEFFDSDSPLIFLKDVPRTKHLKITVADNYRDLWEIDEEDIPSDVEGPIDINFTNLFYIFRDCRVTHKSSRSLRGVSNLDYKQIEYIFIMYLEKIYIYVSPVFSRIFALNCTDLQIEICTFLPLDFLLDGNIIFKAWNKSNTDFNDDFFECLLKELTDYFPTYMCMHKRLQMKVTEAPSNWYCIDSCEGFERILDNLPEKVTLTDFCRREGTVLRCNRPITLVSESKTLKNITYLRLSNICLKEDFFATLFVQCKNLYTLDVYIEKRGRLGTYRGSSLSLSNSIYLTKSLKNIKLTSEDIEYEMIFASLCQCPTLENIHICEYERTVADDEIDVQNILLLIEKCNDLYSLFIEADMSPESLTILMAPLRAAAQNLQRDHLCIEVCDSYGGWNPFADVFNPSPLHILD